MSDSPVPKQEPSSRQSDDPAASVAVSNRQSLPVDEQALGALAASVLRREGVRTGELSLSFVEPEEMADLHQRYAGEPGPTDVLSFPMDEDGLLGDVVVCPAEARANNSDLPSELRLLVVHGVLHLLGYDHEDKEQRRAMWAKQEAYSGVRSS
jgi:probable rRNA maturation factor